MLTIYSVDNAVESFPSANPNSYITLHYTKPTRDVVIDSEDSSSLLYDIATIDETAAGLNAVSIGVLPKLKVQNRIRLSVCYDSTKVDEIGVL